MICMHWIPSSASSSLPPINFTSSFNTSRNLLSARLFPTSSSFWRFHHLFCEHVQTMSSLASLALTPNRLKCASVPLMSYFPILSIPVIPMVKLNIWTSACHILLSAEWNKANTTNWKNTFYLIFLISLPTFEGFVKTSRSQTDKQMDPGGSGVIPAGSASLRHHSVNWEERDGGASEHSDARVVVAVGLERLIRSSRLPYCRKIERNVSFKLHRRRRGRDKWEVKRTINKYLKRFLFSARLLFFSPTRCHDGESGHMGNVAAVWSEI